MKRIPVFVKNWFVNAWWRLCAFNLAPRGLRIILVLVLALVVGSAGGPLPAQAAPASDETIHFSLLATKIKGNRTVCIGDEVPIRVLVMQSQMTGIQGDNVKSLPGVRVVASMSNEAVGKLNPIAVDTGFSALDPGTIDYTFQAERVGKTTISFSAEIKRIWWGSKVLFWRPPIEKKAMLKDSVDVKVEDCFYEVTVISQWTGAFAGTVPGGQAGFDQVAIINQAVMGLDSPGQYSGTADVNWVISETVPQGNCPPHPVTLTSQADLFGTLNEDSQQLEVEIGYKLLEGRFLSWIWMDLIEQCTNSGDALIQYIPDRLRFTVPSYGGSKVPPHTVVDGLWGGGEYSGNAHVIVEPVTGQ